MVKSVLFYCVPEYSSCHKSFHAWDDCICQKFTVHFPTADNIPSFIEVSNCQPSGQRCTDFSKILGPLLKSRYH